MKKVVNSIAGIFLLLVGASCQKPTSAGWQQYTSYVEDADNGLKKYVVAGDIQYQFQYKPQAYIAYRELAGSNDKSVFDKRCSDLKRTIWFNIAINTKDSKVNPLKSNLSNEEDYNARLSYFLTQAEHEILLRYNGEEIEPAIYHFENNYGLTPTDIMVVGFKIPDDEPLYDVSVEYNDVVFNNGLIKATISSEDIKNMPRLEL